MKLLLAVFILKMTIITGCNPFKNRPVDCSEYASTHKHSPQNLYRYAKSQSSDESWERLLLPEKAMNLAAINTEWDDYNSADPALSCRDWSSGAEEYSSEEGSSDDWNYSHEIYFSSDEYGDTDGYTLQIPLIYSSNRKSGGEHFDYVFEGLTVEINEREQFLQLNKGEITSQRTFPYWGISFDAFLKRVNTDADQFGPSFAQGKRFSTFMYTTKDRGNLDIRFLTESGEFPVTGSTGEEIENDPVWLDAINGDFDEAYPHLYSQKERADLYFSSNRAGQFDIYSTRFDIELAEYSSQFITTQLRDSITTVASLSSDGDDTCPFIFGDYIYFVSNREGGYGGYDIWRARFDKEKRTFGEPINLGPSVNSSANDFRPIVIEYSVQNLLVFSSDREGGKGGFDLYYMGEPVIINQVKP
ncbi:MAG: hypothetical protein OCC49_00875 [Fibrobacterales bacterium]